MLHTLSRVVSIPFNALGYLGELVVRVLSALANNFATGIMLGFAALYMVLGS